jgi:hypothetical protein
MGDPHYLPCCKGGNHGRNPGGTGLAVLVLPDGRAIVFKEQGEHTVPFPQ